MVIEHVWCKSSVRWAYGYNERFAVSSVSLRAIRLRRVGCEGCRRSWIRYAADRLYPYMLRNFCNLRRIFIVSETRIESTTWNVTTSPWRYHEILLCLVPLKFQWNALMWTSSTLTGTSLKLLPIHELNQTY